MKMYQFLNLLHRGTAFSDILYTFGRYYSNVYIFVIDFNIILGNDLCLVYNEMVKNVARPACQ
jgi:hypothetical protein